MGSKRCEISKDDGDLLLRWGSTRRYRCQNPEPESNNNTNNNNPSGDPPPPRRSLLLRIPIKATTDDKEQEQEQAPPPPPEPPHWNLRSRAAAAAAEEEKKKKKKATVFTFTLSKEEIEADFLAITGSKPPPRRSANRRPRTLQNEIDCMSPGIFLPETVDANRYRVPKSSSQY